MADRTDKQNRKAALAAWKAQQRAAARAALPLPIDQMQALFDMLDVELPRSGCDHTLRLVRAWCNQQGIPFGAVDDWLLGNGGCCDCEALANAEEAFLEAIREPGNDI
jgi:hypothetical protein